MLLILSEPNDAHIPFLLPKLEARRAEYLWFDPGNFPAEAQISLGFNTSGLCEHRLQHQGRTVDLSRVTAVWWRRPSPVTAGAGVQDPKQRDFVERVSQRFLNGLWELLDCPWLPGKPSAERVADNKLVQLAVAARLGFTVPQTLVTNNPGDFLDFYNEHHSSIINKSLINLNLAVGEAGDEHSVLYTRTVRRRDVVNYQSVRHSPVIFQTYVPKNLELRVTVVGTRVFAAGIDSQGSRSTRHDWRHYDDLEVRYGAYTLPSEIEQRCVRLVAELGLTYGAIDLIRTPTGEYIFLEINPNGQWGFIETLTGLPIADAIADFLIQERQKVRLEDSTDGE